MIYLFGDSYVQAEKDPMKHFGADHKTWQDLLSEEMIEPHINYGQSGESPITTMKKFQTILEKGFKKDNKMVIVLSYPFRIPWLFEGPNLGWMYESPFEFKITNNPAGILIKFFENDFDIFTEQQHFAIKSMYDSMWTELSFMNFKNICYLSHISKAHTIPMIVFTVYNMKKNKKVFPQYPQINCEDSLLCLDHLNDDLFYYYPTPLHDHSKAGASEGGEKEGINHFTEPNHHILKNIICNHFMGTKYSETFHRSDISVSRKSVDFIYD